MIVAAVLNHGVGMKKALLGIVVGGCLVIGGPAWAVPEVREAVSLLREHNIEALDALYDGLKNDPLLTKDGLRPLTVLYLSFSDQPSLLPHLNAWCETGSHYAFAQRGLFYLYYAWKARGEGWGVTVSPKGADVFDERLTKARADLEKAYELDPSDPFPPALMVTLAMAQGWTRDEMEAWFQRAIQADSLDYTAYARKLSYLMPKWRGSKEEMLTFARDAAASAPPGTPIPMVLVTAHLEMHDRDDREHFRKPEVWQEVEAVLERLVREHPASSLIHARYAIIAHLAGKLELAGQHLDAVKDAAPLLIFDLRDALARVFDALHRSGEYDSLLQSCAAIDPDNLQLPLERLLAARKAKDAARFEAAYHDAVASYTAAIARNPDDPDAYAFLAGTYYEKDKAQAIPYYQKAIELGAEEPKPFLGLVFCYRELGQLDQARAAAEKALKRFPTDPTLHKLIASIERAAGNTEKEMAAEQRAVRLNPEDALGHFDLALSFYSQRKLPEAIEEYKLAVRYKPDYASALYNLGYALYELQRHDEARAVFEKFIALNPPDRPKEVESAHWFIEQINAKRR